VSAADSDVTPLQRLHLQQCCATSSWLHYHRVNTPVILVCAGASHPRLPCIVVVRRNMGLRRVASTVFYITIHARCQRCPLSPAAAAATPLATGPSPHPLPQQPWCPSWQRSSPSAPQHGAQACPPACRPPRQQPSVAPLTTTRRAQRSTPSQGPTSLHQSPQGTDLLINYQAYALSMHG
jgi:hypothetical protein